MVRKTRNGQGERIDQDMSKENGYTVRQVRRKGYIKKGVKRKGKRQVRRKSTLEMEMEKGCNWGHT